MNKFFFIFDHKTDCTIDYIKMLGITVYAGSYKEGLIKAKIDASKFSDEWYFEEQY